MQYHKRIGIWIRVLKSFLLSFGGSKGVLLTAEETINELLKKRSLIRFGDGEFGIYRGKNIHYQDWSAQLQEAFEEIKAEYESDSACCPFLLAVPRRFMTVNGFRLMRKRVYVSSWAESRLDFKRNFRHDIPYGDAFLFEKSNKEIYPRIWNSEACPKNVIFIHNQPQYAQCFAVTYNKNVAFIQCPARNAFLAVDALMDAVLGTIVDFGWSKDDVMLTISAGPAGKVLVHRLSKRGYWCIDAGHCWDDPLEGI